MQAELPATGSVARRQAAVSSRWWRRGALIHTGLLGGSHRRSRDGTRGLPRLAVKPDEAAEMLGVSRDYFDEHIKHELRIVRRGSKTILFRSPSSSAGLKGARHDSLAEEPTGSSPRSEVDPLGRAISQTGPLC